LLQIAGLCLERGFAGIRIKVSECVFDCGDVGLGGLAGKIAAGRVDAIVEISVAPVFAYKGPDLGCGACRYRLDCAVGHDRRQHPRAAGTQLFKKIDREIIKSLAIAVVLTALYIFHASIPLE
jgi:hypothetical protein